MAAPAKKGAKPFKWADLKYSFFTGHRGPIELFKVLRGAGGKVKLGFVGAKAQKEKRIPQWAKKAAKKEGKEPPETEETVVDIAIKHEFGLGVPVRSMIRAWTDRNQAMIRDDIRKAIDRVAIGRLTTDQALKVLGVKWVGSLQEFIATASNFKPLSPETIERKGSSSPLIDTGQMRSAVTSEIEK